MKPKEAGRWFEMKYPDLIDKADQLVFSSAILSISQHVHYNTVPAFDRFMTPTRAEAAVVLGQEALAVFAGPTTPTNCIAIGGIVADDLIRRAQEVSSQS